MSANVVRRRNTKFLISRALMRKVNYAITDLAPDTLRRRLPDFLGADIITPNAPVIVQHDDIRDYHIHCASRLAHNICINFFQPAPRTVAPSRNAIRLER